MYTKVITNISNYENLAESQANITTKMLTLSKEMQHK